MCHRSINGNVELPSRFERRRSGESCEITRTRGKQSRFRPMRAAQAKIDQQSAGHGEHRTRRFAGDKRLVVQQIHHPTLNELRLA
jgi:hypothetical protein